jgi:gp32 DNA binding protein like
VDKIYTTLIQGYKHMASLATLKKSSADIGRLTKEIEKLNAPQEGGGYKEDERFWQPEVDKAGNGYAVIRFLPAPAVDGDEALPWVRIFNHGFKGPTGKWYIENSLTTIGQKDPVSEYNTILWNSTTDENSPLRKQVREQKRKLTYISNIMVVKDPAHPENEGKIRLYKFGKKIFDKITLAMNPQYEDETPLNPFDFWNGANFKIKIRQVEGYRNYDLSSFDAPTALGNGDDAELEKIWNSEYSLQEFLAPKNFKSYADLKTKLESVLELNVAAAPAAPRGMTTAMMATPTSPAPAPTVEAAKVDDIPFEVDAEEDDDMKYFKSLAQ